MKMVHEFAEDDKKEGIEDRPDMIPLKHREFPEAAEKGGVRREYALPTVMVGPDTPRRQDCGRRGFQVEDAEPVVFEAAAVILSAGKNGFRAPGMNIAELTGRRGRHGIQGRGGHIRQGVSGYAHEHSPAPGVEGQRRAVPRLLELCGREGEHIPMMGLDLSMASVIHAAGARVLGLRQRHGSG